MQERIHDVQNLELAAYVNWAMDQSANEKPG